MSAAIRPLFFVCCLIVVVLSKEPLPSKEKTRLKSWQNPEYRLPRNLLPNTYAIRLLPFLDEDDFTIDGLVDVFVTCVTSTNEITLNSLNISFDSSKISVVDLETQGLLNVTNFIDEQTTIQMITIKTYEQLTEGKSYKLSIPFTSYLNNQSQGFYRASYLENGTVRYMAITHMEPANARLAFPCFDEPDMKAKFSIVLGRKKSMVTFSNMPLLYSNPNQIIPGYYWDYYETSVDMPTYLIALIVSEFKTTSSDPAISNVPFRVLTRPEVQNLTGYAVDIGPRFLEFFEDYFGVNYMLAKMDMAAATDFPAGAMENWGLMIFHEEYILYDEIKSSSWNKQLVAEVISHEIVHQWFGNLVTMKWWDNIWLNEGFARYLQNLAVEVVGPEYKILLQFPVEYLQPALIADSVNSSHPMSAPETLDDIFDEIEYDKGASVLRMCADFLGEATFRRGLNRYLLKHKFENTVEADIWQSLNEQVIEDGVFLPAEVSEIMQTWTQQKNYPLVTVQRNDDNSTIHLKQERFVLDRNGQLIVLSEQSWWIPLTFTQSFEAQAQRGWLSTPKDIIIVRNLTVDHWIIFNVNQTGFYRVLYDERNYVLITKQLLEDHTQISSVNRAQIVDDSLNLAAAGALSYVTALNLISYLALEKEYYSWFGALDEIDYIDTMLYNQRIHPDWQKFLIGLVEPFYFHIGFDETQLDDHMVFMSRTLISRWACRLAVQDCVQHASDIYASLMSDPSLIIPPNQRETILRSGVEYGGEREWNFAFQQYREKRNVEFLIALTFAKQSNLIYSLLDEMIAPNSAIEEKDIDPMFKNLASNPLGNYIAVEYLNTHWNAIEQALGLNHFPRFFKYLCRIANTQSQKDKLIILRNSHPDVLDSSEEVREGLAIVDKNLFWVGKYTEEIAYFLVGPQTESTTLSKDTTTEFTSATELTTTKAPSSASILKAKWIIIIFIISLLRTVN